MRKILFRGKRADNGKWVQGSLFSEGTRFEIVRGTCNTVGIEGVEVVPETMGQYTGLTDKNGTKIFEGDILKDISDVGNDQLYEVYYNEDLCAFMLDDQYWITPTRDWLSKDDKNPTTMMLQIIGNIHDNPELLTNDKAEQGERL